jgi:hypothetical protein
MTGPKPGMKEARGGREQIMTKSTTKPATKPALPQGITEADLKYPKYYTGKGPEVLYQLQFEIWYTERFGWCIPTLLIGGVPRRMQGSDVQRRTYAIAIKDGGTVSLGLGPHVLFHFNVYVTSANQARLQKYTDMRQQGLGNAGDIRDRISSRRMQTAARRRNWMSF